MAPKQTNHLLQPIVETMKTSADGDCLAIFDLDSTLYDLTRRVTAIVDRFSRDPIMRQKFPEACERLQAVEVRRTDWGLAEPLGRLNIDKVTHPDLVRELQAAWVKGFFSNDFLDRDFPLPGAVDFVEQCLAANGHVLYLTGRDTPRMGVGTEKSLRESGFPVHLHRARLMLKPDASHGDAEFKADVISSLTEQYKHIWLFENEPVNINAVLRQAPSVKIVFVDTCHSGLEEVTDTFATIQTFDGR